MEGASGRGDMHRKSGAERRKRCVSPDRPRPTEASAADLGKRARGGHGAAGMEGVEHPALGVGRRRPESDPVLPGHLPAPSRRLSPGQAAAAAPTALRQADPAAHGEEADRARPPPSRRVGQGPRRGGHRRRRSRPRRGDLRGAGRGPAGLAALPKPRKAPGLPAGRPGTQMQTPLVSPPATSACPWTSRRPFPPGPRGPRPAGRWAPGTASSSRSPSRRGGRT